MLSIQDHQILQEFRDQLDARAIKYHDVVAFGSRARGDARLDSDLDVLVVVETETPEIRDTIEDCAWEVGTQNDIYVQPVIMERYDAEVGPEKSSLFMLAISQEGIRI